MEYPAAPDLFHYQFESQESEPDFQRAPASAEQAADDEVEFEPVSGKL